jgi:hypothetical protein
MIPILPYKIFSLFPRIVRVPVIAFIGIRLAAGIKDFANVIKVAPFTLCLCIVL